MIDSHTFVFFMTGALLLNFTPGPDMAFTLATSARGGVRAGLAAAAGVGIGSIGWAMMAAAGLAALLAASEHALSVIRITGGVYLLFLAIRTFQHRRQEFSATGRANVVQAFRSAAMTNLLNPKVGLFYLAFLPGFTNPEIGPVWLQTLVLGTIVSFSGAFVLAIVALAAGSARDELLKSRRLQVGLNTAAASAFGGLGLYLLFSRSD